MTFLKIDTHVVGISLEKDSYWRNLRCHIIIKIQNIGRTKGAKDFSKQEQTQSLRLFHQGKDTLEISKILKRDHQTVQRFMNDGHLGRKQPPKGYHRVVTEREMRKLKRIMADNPHKSSKWIFEAAGVNVESKSSRCRILRKLGSVKKKRKFNRP